MMIEPRQPSSWKVQVLEALQCLGNIEEQSKALIGTKDCFYPAPIELYLMLIDDSDFGGFIQLLLERGLRDLAADGHDLFLRLQSFPDEKLDSAAIFEDREWIEICAIARQLADNLTPVSLA
jgi:hypothetical protein